MLIWELVIIGLLILLNGFFAMSELAIVSSRRARLQQLVQAGRPGAASALRLADDPTGFLSTVQIGITLVGIFAGAYSGATLATPLAEYLATYPVIGGRAETVAFAVVVVGITYFSLIIGELVPKRMALNNAEAIAVVVAPVMRLLSRIGAPVVWFLRISTNALLALLGVRPKSDAAVTEEEVKTMIAEGTDAGVFHPSERSMIEGVLRLDDRSVRSVMVPRPDVVWLDADGPAEAALDRIAESGHSRFPVSRGTIDEVFGIVHAKDLLHQRHAGGPTDLAAAARDPLFVNESMHVLTLLERFKSSPVHMAVVLDEHGGIEGIVTPVDILIAIAGDLPESEHDTPYATQRDDGSWLLDGRMVIDDVERTLDLDGMVDESSYTTLAGFMLDKMQHLPEVGENFAWKGWRFEVVDLDGRRIDKVLATPEPT